MRFGSGGALDHHSREDDAPVSPAQEKVLVALTVLAFTEAFQLVLHNLLPVIVRSILAP